MEQNGATSISQLPSSNQIANSIENIPQNANMMNSSNMNNIVIRGNNIDRLEDYLNKNQHLMKN